MTSTSLPATTLSDGGRLTDDLGHKSRYLLISLCVLVLDLASKLVIESQVIQQGLGGASAPSWPVIPNLLNFTYVKNTGVAFGLFASHGQVSGPLILTLLGLAALGFVAYYFCLVPRSDRMLLVALALVIGGAVGNLTDRIMNGGVTDFIDFYFGTYHWHTFNIADTAISIGIGLMLLSTFWPRRTAADIATEAATAAVDE